MIEDHLERLGQAVDAHLGQDAVWNGIPPSVRVEYRSEDEDLRLGDSEAIVTARTVRVRRSVVPEPRKGDEIYLPGLALALKVKAQPRLDDDGVWTCPVVPA